MGSVAISADYYLMAKLGMRLLAEYPAREFFDLQRVEVKEGLILAGRLPIGILNYQLKFGVVARCQEKTNPPSGLSRRAGGSLQAGSAGQETRALMDSH